MIDSAEGILKSVETDARQNLEGQMDLFGMMGGEQEQAASDYKIPNTPEYPAGDLLKMEKEVSGLYLSGHPLDAAPRSARSPPAPSPTCRARTPNVLTTRTSRFFVRSSKIRS